MSKGIFIDHRGNQHIVDIPKHLEKEFENKKIKELQQRIDKAIEYIGQELLVYDNESDEYKVGIKLLEILDFHQ